MYLSSEMYINDFLKFQLSLFDMIITRAWYIICILFKKEKTFYIWKYV